MRSLPRGVLAAGRTGLGARPAGSFDLPWNDHLDAYASHPAVASPALAGALALIGAPFPATASASAARAVDPLGFQIQVPAGGLTVDENAGQAVITVDAQPGAESSAGAQVRYITSGDGYDPSTNAPFDCGGTPCTATSYDFTSVKGELDFRPGSDQQELLGPDRRPRHRQRAQDVPGVAVRPLADRPRVGLARRCLTILNDDPVARDRRRQPARLLAGTDERQPAGRRAVLRRSAERRRPSAAQLAPGAQRDRPASPEPHASGASATAPRTCRTSAPRCRATSPAPPPTEPGTVPLLATYRLVHGVRGQRGFARRAAGLPQLHRRLRAGDRLLPRGPVPGAWTR